MATQSSRFSARMMLAPAVILLLAWMLIPLYTTVMFSFKEYLPLKGDEVGGLWDWFKAFPTLDWVGFDNYSRFFGSSSFWPSVGVTALITLSVLFITIVLGVLLAILLDQPMWGQGIVRILVIAPFFVMPAVSGLVWRNMFMDSNNGFFAHIARGIGVEPVEFLSQVSLPSIIFIVSWQWLPFATLILLTAVQSLDGEQIEAAEIDGASIYSRFWYLVVPHLTRAITIVLLIQTIFLLSLFAEIFVTTAGAFGTKTLSYLIYQRVLESQNVGLGSAGGVYAIIMANIVAIFLMRFVGKNLDA